MAVLAVDLRALEGGALDVQGKIDPADPMFEGLDVQLTGPLEVEGRLRRTGEDEYFWQASLRAPVTAACRRCLRDVPVVVASQVSALYTTDEAALEDPSAYPMEPRATRLDLSESVREELALSAPQFPLCRDDCKGLCPQCGADLNTERCDCTAHA